MEPQRLQLKAIIANDIKVLVNQEDRSYAVVAHNREGQLGIGLTPKLAMKLVSEVLESAKTAAYDVPEELLRSQRGPVEYVEPVQANEIGLAISDDLTPLLRLRFGKEWIAIALHIEIVSALRTALADFEAHLKSGSRQTQ